MSGTRNPLLAASRPPFINIIISISVGISIAVAVWQTLSFAVDRSRQVVKWWHYGKFKGGIGQKTCCCLVCLFINVIISVRVAVSKMLESPPRHEEEISLSKLTIIPGGIHIFMARVQPGNANL